MAFVTDRSRWEAADHAVIWAFILGYLALSWVFPGTLLRPIFRAVLRALYRIKVFGPANVPKTGGALLVCNHSSYIDWMILYIAAPRRVRYLVWAGYRKNPLLRLFLSWAKTIPIEGRRPKLEDIDQAFEATKQALANGDLVCIFAEGRLTRNGFLRPFHRGLELLEKKIPVPIIPVCIANIWGSWFSHKGGRIMRKWPEVFRRPISVYFGQPLPPATRAKVVRQHVQRCLAFCARDGNHWSVPPHRRFVRIAARVPLRQCYVDALNKRKLNYGKTLAGAICLARWLKEKLGPEKMVGTWLPSSVGGALANVALAFLGRVSVNLNYTASAESVLSSIKQTGMKQILTSRLFVRRVPLEVPAHEGPADDEKVQVIYLEDALGAIKNWQRVASFLGVVLLPGWVIEYLWLRLGRHKLDDLATVIFSSGSTGEPKGVMLSHRNIAANIDSVIAAIDLNKKDVALGSLPFFHSFGYTVTLWAPLQIGASIVYYPDPRQAKEIGEICRTYNCNVLVSTATFLRYYLKRCDANDFKTLRYLVCGAEKLPPSLAEEFRAKFGILPLEGYGCTELSPVASANVPDVEIRNVKQIGTKMGTIGQCLPMIAAKIVGPETFEEVPLGQDGLIMVTGANVMVGYLGTPELTAKVIRDGWYDTGDIGHMDDEGFITLTGRLSRFAKIGGEMVPLEKIEEELHATLDTTDRFFAVTSVPDAARGERLVILHTELPGTDARAVFQKLGGRNLPNLWLPKERDFYQVAELPLLGSGKLDLKRVKQIAFEKTKN